MTNQPRVPAGTPEGGQFAPKGGGPSSSQSRSLRHLAGSNAISRSNIKRNEDVSRVKVPFSREPTRRQDLQLENADIRWQQRNIKIVKQFGHAALASSGLRAPIHSQRLLSKMLRENNKLLRTKGRVSYNPRSRYDLPPGYSK